MIWLIDGLDGFFRFERVDEEAGSDQEEEEGKELTPSEIEPDRGIRLPVIFDDNSSYGVEETENAAEDAVVGFGVEDTYTPKDSEKDDAFGQAFVKLGRVAFGQDGSDDVFDGRGITNAFDHPLGRIGVGSVGQRRCRCQVLEDGVGAFVVDFLKSLVAQLHVFMQFGGEFHADP